MRRGFLILVSATPRLVPERVSTLYDTPVLKDRLRKGVLGKLPMGPARTEDGRRKTEGRRKEDEEGRPHAQPGKDAYTDGREGEFERAQSQGAFSSQATPSSLVNPSRLPAFVWMQTKRMP